MEAAAGLRTAGIQIRRIVVVQTQAAPFIRKIVTAVTLAVNLVAKQRQSHARIFFIRVQLAVLIIFQLAPFKTQAHVLVVAAAAPDGITPGGMHRVRSTVAVGSIVLITQNIMQMAVTNFQLITVFVKGNIIGQVPVILAAAGGQTGNSQGIALVGRVQPVIVHAQLVASRVTIAIVIYEHAADRTFMFVDHKSHVAGARFAARGNGNFAVRRGQVADQPHTTFNLAALNIVARFQTDKLFLNLVIINLGIILHQDLVVLADDGRQVHDTFADTLRRQIDLGHHIILVLQIFGNSIGSFP